MVKSVKRNYNLNKFGNSFIQAFIDAYKPMINELNRQIYETTERSVDIHGKKFKSLKKSTTNIRKQRGQPEQPPLKITGKMRGTKIIQATKAKPSFEIEMTGQRRNVYYGSLHNEGFTTGGMIPGKKVPARNWFGIPKEYKKGGKRYEEASRQMRFRLRRSLQSAMKKVA
jgi:hypothetical protein